MNAVAEIGSSRLGVLCLSPEKAKAISNMIHFTVNAPATGGGALQSITFIGPELCGITTNEDELNLPPDLLMDLNKEGVLLLDLPDATLNKLQAIDAEVIVVDKDGEVTWHCETDQDVYKVWAPKKFNWDTVQDFIKAVDRPAARDS
jgi:hypothetical protein